MKKLIINMFHSVRPRSTCKSGRLTVK